MPGAPSLSSGQVRQPWLGKLLHFLWRNLSETKLKHIPLLVRVYVCVKASLMVCGDVGSEARSPGRL